MVLYIGLYELCWIIFAMVMSTISYIVGATFASNYKRFFRKWHIKGRKLPW